MLTEESGTAQNQEEETDLRIMRQVIFEVKLFNTSYIMILVSFTFCL